MSEEHISCPLCGNRNSSDRVDCKVCGTKLADMDDDEKKIITALTNISGVGSRRAKNIVDAGLDNIQKLEKADIDNFLSVDGIGESTAKDIIDTLEMSVKEEGGVYLCSNCGAFVSVDAEECSHCGALMEDEEDEGIEIEESTPVQEENEEEESSLYLCNNCGSFISAQADECSHCGFVLDDEEEFEKSVERQMHPDKKMTEEGLFLCVNCGSFVSAGVKECNSCGYLFEDEVETEDKEPHEDVQEIIEEEGFQKVIDEDIQEPESEEDLGWVDDDELDIDKNELKELDREIEKTLEEEYGLSSETIQTLSLGHDIKMCGNCGGINEPDQSSCSICGYMFEEGELQERDKETWDIEEATKRFSDALGIDDIPDTVSDQEDDKGIEVCTVCGAFRGDDTERCNICGSLVSEAPSVEELSTDERVKEEKIYICDACGAFIDSSSDTCGLCGSDLKLARRNIEDEELIEEETSFDSDLLEKVFSGDDTSLDEDELRICDNCGALMHQEEKECYICGGDPGDPLTLDDPEIDELQGDIEVEDELKSLLDDIKEEEMITEPEYTEEVYKEETSESESELIEEDFFEGPDESLFDPDFEDDVGISDEELTEIVEEIDHEIDHQEEEEEFDASAALEEISRTVKESVDKKLGKAEDEVAIEILEKDDEDWKICPSCDSYMNMESDGCSICGFGVEDQISIKKEEKLSEDEDRWIESIISDKDDTVFTDESLDSLIDEESYLGNIIKRVKDYQVPVSTLSLFAFSGLLLYTQTEGEGFFYVGLALVVSLGIFFSSGLITSYHLKDQFKKLPHYGWAGFILAMLMALFVPLNQFFLRISFPLIVNAGLISVSLGIFWMLHSILDIDIRQYLPWMSGIVLLLICTSAILIRGAYEINELGYAGIMSIGLGSILVIGSTVTWYRSESLETELYENIEIGHRHLIHGDYEDALVSFERAVKKSKTVETPEDDIEFPLYSKGLALCNMGEYEKAIRTFKKVLEIAPGSVATWNNLGTAYSRMGEQKLAVKCLKKALEIDSGYEVSWNNLGNAFFRRGDYSKALECYDQALDINSSYRDATVNKTQCLVKLGKGV